MVDRLAPAPIARAVRRLSGTQEDIEEQLQRPPPNEYFQQAYRAQHPNELALPQERDRARNVIDGIKDRLSPAGALIGEAIRKLSHTETDAKITAPQTEYLRQLHAAAIADQNKRQGAVDDDDDEQDSQDFNALNLMVGLKERIGQAVRRLSTYEDDDKNNLSARETFHFFQRGDSRRSGHHTRSISKANDILLSKKKKKKSWKDLFTLTKLKRQVVLVTESIYLSVISLSVSPTAHSVSLRSCNLYCKFNV